MVLAHFSSGIGNELMSVIQSDTEAGIGVGFGVVIDDQALIILRGLVHYRAK